MRGGQVGAQTETELKEKKLRVEDALNATKVRPSPLCSNCCPDALLLVKSSNFATWLTCPLRFWRYKPRNKKGCKHNIFK